MADAKPTLPNGYMYDEDGSVIPVPRFPDRGKPLPPTRYRCIYCGENDAAISDPRPSNELMRARDMSSYYQCQRRECNKAWRKLTDGEFYDTTLGGFPMSHKRVWLGMDGVVEVQAQTVEKPIVRLPGTHIRDG